MLCWTQRFEVVLRARQGQQMETRKGLDGSLSSTLRLGVCQLWRIQDHSSWIETTNQWFVWQTVSIYIKPDKSSSLGSKRQWYQGDTRAEDIYCYRHKISRMRDDSSKTGHPSAWARRTGESHTHVFELCWHATSHMKIAWKWKSDSLQKNLTYLRLAYNVFGGTMPSSMSKLTKLELLQFQGNRISGAIPDMFIPKPKGNNTVFVSDCGSPSMFSENPLNCTNCTVSFFGRLCCVTLPTLKSHISWFHVWLFPADMLQCWGAVHRYP